MKKSQSPEHAPRKTARNSKKTELEIFGQPAEAPMTCGRAAEPHYDDTIPPHMPADELLPTPDATPPGAEPMAPGSLKTPASPTRYAPSTATAPTAPTWRSPIRAAFAWPTTRTR